MTERELCTEDAEVRVYGLGCRDLIEGFRNVGFLGFRAFRVLGFQGFMIWGFLGFRVFGGVRVTGCWTL